VKCAKTRINTGFSLHRASRGANGQKPVKRHRFGASFEHVSPSTKETDEVKDLEQRKQDLKSKIQQLNQELMPLLARVQELRDRIGILEDDRKDVLEKLSQRKEYR
jgi:chromosome segregation ATPase